MYDFRYINKNQQPSNTSYTLIIEDLDGDENSQQFRIEKTFKCDPQLIDDEFLRAEALKEIELIKTELANITVEVP